MRIAPAKKMAVFTPAIFGDLKEAAAKKQRESGSIIDLSLGSPDLPPDERVRQKLAEESLREDTYYYTLTGLERFNQAVADYYWRRVNVNVDPQTEVLLTMGSQEGLVHFPMAFCDPGDIVLTTDPAYIAYDVGIKLADAIPYYMPLLAENEFLPDLDAIPEDIAQKAKVMILNLPGNPVPATPSVEYFRQVVAFAKKYNILVLHDAAYSEYYFTGDKPISFLSVEGAKDVGLEINSLSKSFSLAGARIAYFIGNKTAIQILRQFKSNLDYGVFAPIQKAAITAFTHAEEITDRLRAIFSERHRIVMDGLRRLGWQASPSNGGMFVWAKYPYEIDDVTFVYQAIEQVGVVMIPGSIFGENGAGYVRIALVQDKALLSEAMQRLQQLDI